MAISKIFFYMMLFLSASFNLSVFAQTTSYYALLKIQEYDKVISKCNGGQFVKVSKNICFDTDSKGNDVGNGKLYRELNNHSNEHIYTGDSFHGKARYIFNADYSMLTVEINPHFKYYYKRSSVPNGVLTCSLIKKRNRGNETISNGYNNSTQWNNSYNNSGANPNNRNSYNNSSSPQTRQFKCTYCNGTGRIEKNDNAPANFGTDRPRQRCNECGKWYDPDVFTHYHQQCRHCSGTGYAK